MYNKFKIEATDGMSRTGIIETIHGNVETPVFMPVATQGSVKSVSSEDLYTLGASIILSNIYHLMLRPGIETIEHLGGLHKFMNWSRPILTDSGGFQTFSLSNLGEISESGATFKSHIDGSRQFLSPETSIQYQSLLGVDIAMVLDHCVPYGTSDYDIRVAMERTYRWAIRSKNANDSKQQSLFSIIQGGLNTDLRLESAETLISIGFDGYAIGGLSVGEPKEDMYKMVSLMGNILPQEKPRYLMGVGSPEDLVKGVSLGMDMFDCVLPTRVARNGSLFTKFGRINLTNAVYRKLNGPIDDSCDCYTCSTYSIAYLNHLFKSRELLVYRLATIHNLSYVTTLMNNMRESIRSGKFESFKDEFFSTYRVAKSKI